MLPRDTCACDQRLGVQSPGISSDLGPGFTGNGVSVIAPALESRTRNFHQAHRAFYLDRV